MEERWFHVVLLVQETGQPAATMRLVERYFDDLVFHIGATDNRINLLSSSYTLVYTPEIKPCIWKDGREHW